MKSPLRSQTITLTLLWFLLSIIPAKPSTVELLSNGNFELGNNGVWQVNSFGGPLAAGVTNGSFPLPGERYYGYVGNSINSTGSLFQVFAVPANAGIATITFYLNVGSKETAQFTAYDVMDVNLRTASPDSLIYKLETFSNLNKATDGAYTKKQLFYDLTAYRGGNILLQFYATNDSSSNTIFRIEGVSVAVDVIDTPSTPTGLAATATSTQITLRWNDVSGESDYELQWATTSNGPWTQLGLAGQNSTSFTDSRAGPGVEYWYQIRSRNSELTSPWSSAISAALNLTPFVTTETASDVTSHGGTLHGIVNPRGVSTSARFDYGKDKNYGNATAPVQLRVDSTDQAVSTSVTGLDPDTDYHFKLTAVNAVNQVGAGQDFILHTQPAGGNPVAVISGDLTPVTGLTPYYGRYSTGTLLRYSWWASNGQTSTETNPSFSFNSPGFYSVSLTVTDASQRQSTASISVNVQAGNNGITPGRTVGADPVVLSTGNYVQSHTDLKLPGTGFPFEFKRFYNSKFSEQSGVPLGFGWTFNYNARVRETGTNVLVIEGDGSTLTFAPSLDGFSPEPGVYETLVHNSDGNWSLTSKSQVVRVFDASGKLVSVSDKNSNVLSLSYVSGALNEIYDTAGRIVRFNRNSYGCISEITDPLGRKIRFEYDADTNLIAVVDANSGTNRYGYDSYHRMTNAFDARGTLYLQNYYDPTNFTVLKQCDAFTNWTFFQYDFPNRITYQTNSLGKVSAHSFNETLQVTNIVDEGGFQQSFAYDSNRNQTLVRDRNGNQTRYEYDALGNLTNRTDALGNTSSVQYNALNNPISRKDELNNSTTFGYSAVGNLIASTNALGLTNGIQYYANGLPFITTDARGFSTTNEYDTKGNLVAVFNAQGFVTRFGYDAVGRKTNEVDALNRTNSFFYDNNDNLLYTINALGLTNSYKYDENNNRISAENARGATTTNVFDVKDRLIATIDPLNHTNSAIFDVLDRKIGSRDTLGNLTVYAYDDLGNLVAVTNALMQVTRFTSDAEGNQTSTTDPTGHYITNSFDSLNRKVEAVNSSISTNLNGFDSLGRVVIHTNASKQITQFSFDAIGRLTNVIDAANQTSAFVYDENGNRVVTIDPNSHSWTNIFDELNRTIEQHDPLGHKTVFHYDAVGNLTNKVTANGDSITFFYDGLNRLTNIVYPTGPSVSFVYDAIGNRTNMVDGLGTTSWEYDLSNRLVKVTDAFGQIVAYGYDDNGNRTRITYPGDKVVHYGFDRLNRLIALTNWLGGIVTYSYDSRGNVNTTTNANNTVVAFDSDAANRLFAFTNFTGSGGIMASYLVGLDGVGNRRQAIAEQPLLPILRNETNVFVSDADNRLVELDGETITNSANGALTGIGSNIYTYDAEDRLVGIASTNLAGAFGYDGLGNRLWATINGQKRQFVVDRSSALTQVLIETDGDGSPKAFYVYGRGLAQRITPDGQTLTYHFDIQGSTIALTDSGGTLTDSYAYDSFGGLENSSGDSDQPFRYLGQYGIIDDGTGLYYARARFFSSEFGRFLSKDPLLGQDSDGQTLNRYAYALNNAIRFRDPSGLVATEGPFQAHNVTAAQVAYWRTFWPELQAALADNTGNALFAISLTADVITFWDAFGPETAAGLAARSQLRALADKLRNSPRELTATEAQIAVTKVNSSVGWKVGQPINNLTSEGNVPSWSAVRQRFWKNEALNTPYKYDDYNLLRMQRGLAPQRINDTTGIPESMELHHAPPQREGGLFDFRPLWPSEHAAIDPYVFR